MSFLSSMWTDQVKLWFLMACLAGCLSTLFTSSSYLMGNANLKVLAANPMKHCHHAREQAKTCLQGNHHHRPQQARVEEKIKSSSIASRHALANSQDDASSADNNNSPSHDDHNNDSPLSCSLLLSQVTKCEKAVEKAYDYINMGGCPKELQAVTVCEVEWCSSGRYMFLQNHHHHSNKVSSTSDTCKKECHTVRENLDHCIKHHVKQYFTRYKLDEDGVIKQKI